jgi:hypothetical protein
MSCEFVRLGTSIASNGIGIRAVPDSSRQERLVAIASVALPERECAGTLEPRNKRGVSECIQRFGMRQAGRRARVGIPAKREVRLLVEPAANRDF